MADYTSQLLTILSKEELEKKIAGKVEEFHGYLSKDAAIMLLAKEHGIYKKEIIYSKISEIPKEGKGINLRAKVLSISPTINYPSGKRAREIVLANESGKIPFVLWEEKLKLLDKIRLNDELEIHDAYERNGKLNIGYRGKIAILSKKEFTLLDSLVEREAMNVRGAVRNIEIEKKEGKEKISFILSDAKARQRTIVSEGIARFSLLEENDELLLENVELKDSALIVSSASRVFIRKPKNIITGKVDGMALEEGSKLKLNISGKDFVFEGEEAYKALNAKQSEHVALETLIKLKSEYYMGKRIFIKIKNKSIESVSVS